MNFFYYLIHLKIIHLIPKIKKIYLLNQFLDIRFMNH
jgi:hypothetical protein